MFKTFLFGCVLFVWTVNIFAQIANQAETKWEKYGFSEHHFSVSLPKQPVVIKTRNIGVSEQREEYGAYSNGVVYVVASAYELKDSEKKYAQVLKEPFTNKNFALRLSQIRHRYRALDLVETQITRNNIKGAQFSNGEWNLELYFIPEQKRWYELWAVHRGRTAPETKRFFESFKIVSNATGKTIGEGATEVIGDIIKLKYTLQGEEPKEIGLKDPKNPNRRLNVFESVRIVLMPRPSYPEEASGSNTSGTVRLRVTFANNGSITDMQPLNKLPNGLTEAAIAAAKKILFVPAVANNEFVSTTKIIEYNFSSN